MVLSGDSLLLGRIDGHDDLRKVAFGDLDDSFFFGVMETILERLVFFRLSYRFAFGSL